jgi:hypothetical protein
MKFEDWWNILPMKEQKLIGKNNAMYVWGQACEQCALLCDEAEKRYKELWNKFDYEEDQGRSLASADLASSIRKLGGKQ